MKLKINRDQLSRCLSVASGAISSNASLPVLQNILLSAGSSKLEATGTNLDLTIRNSVKAEVEREGQATVNARKLLAITNGLQGGEVEIETDAKRNLKLRAGKSCYNINGTDPAEYPPIKEPEVVAAFSLPQSQLKSLLAACAFAVCKDGSRFALLGELLEAKGQELTVAAADGRRLALKAAKLEKQLKKDARVTIPSKAASEIASLMEGKGDADIIISENLISVTSGDSSVISKLVDAVFPDHRAILPKTYETLVLVSRSEFIEAASRASLVTSEKSGGIKMVFGKKALTITARSAEFGDAIEELDAQIKEGSPVEISANPTYVIEALKSAEGKEVKVHMNDSRSPFTFTDAAGYSCTISPLLPT
jgi:DNA polymerase-3 subunit beta